MSYRSVDPTEAKGLLDAGWSYVDVRSEAEFAQGHPVGAVNVPILHFGPGGPRPNPDFLGVMSRLYTTDTKLVLGCKSGGRSARACQVLAGAGYADLANMDGGFSGAVSPAGTVIQAGWSQSGLPTTTDGTPWAELSRG